MLVLLELGVTESRADRHRRARKMLAFWRPRPRMGPKRFELWIRGLIPGVDAAVGDALYRSSLVPNARRKDLEQTLFAAAVEDPTAAELTIDGKPIINPAVVLRVTAEEWAVGCADFEAVLQRWRDFQPELAQVTAALRGPAPEIQTLLSEVQHLRYEVVEAKMALDHVAFAVAFQRLFQRLVTASWRLAAPEPQMVADQIADLRVWVEKKFKELPADQGSLGSSKPEEGLASSRSLSSDSSRRFDTKPVPVPGAEAEAEPPVRDDSGRTPVVEVSVSFTEQRLSQGKSEDSAAPVEVSIASASDQSDAEEEVG